MKKKNYILQLLLMMGIMNICAQDTLFYEDFNAWEPMRIIDSVFTNFDEDGLTAANGLPNDWFVAPLSNGGADSTEFAAISASWLNGYAHGNRNWMTLPPITLGDSAATLSWRSAPALGDLYLDGYTVVVSTDDVYYNSIYYSDTLMHFAQNMNDNANDFSDGIRHTNFDMNAGISLTTTVQYPGLLSSWSVDLSAYKNKTVYLSFLHDSDDDNYIAIDDILVTGKSGSPVNTGILVSDKNEGHGIKVWPRLVVDKLNLSFNEGQGDITTIRLYTMLGHLVKKIYRDLGADQTEIDCSGLNSGTYFISAGNGESNFTAKFIKQ